MEYTMTKTLVLDNTLVNDLMDEAPQAIAYWAHTITNNHDEETITITYDGEDFTDDTGERTITYLDLAQALEKISNGGIVNDGLYSQANDYLNGSFGLDQDLTDCIIQVALFDTIIYG